MKTSPLLFVFSLAALLLGAASANAQQTITVPPVHRYSFGNSSGALADGTVVLDSLGAAHATVRGAGATASGTGIRVTGGPSTSAPYIDLPNGVASGSAKSFPGYARATYEVWVTVHRNLSWSRILDFGRNESGEITAPGGTFNGTDYLHLSANIGTAADMRIERGGASFTGGAGGDVVGGTTLNQQAHLVVTYDAAAGAWLLYKNGALVKTITTLLGPDTIHDVNVWLGRSNWAGDSNADATYDEFRIYDYTLNAQQVLGNYQAGPATLTSGSTQTGPIVHYKFDELSGTTAGDASGNGNPGTLAGSAAFASGQMGNAYSGDGSTSGAQTPAAITLPNPEQAISIAAWIKPTNWAGGNRRIVQKGANNDQYRLLANGGVLTFEIANPARSVTTALPALNVWSHVAGTYDGATLRLFINGTEAASAAATGALAITSDPLFVGTKSAASAAGERFAGMIDDARIYNRALAASEVNTLATVGAIAAADPIAQVGTSDTAAFAITRTGSTASALTMNFTIATGTGQATTGQRYTVAPAAGSVTIPIGQTSATVAITPTSDTAVLGTQSVTLNLSAAAAYSLSNTATAVVQLLDSPINAWKIQTFGSLAAAQSPLAASLANPDSDALLNLWEYFHGTSPTAHTANPIQVQTLGNRLAITFPRNTAASDVIVTVQGADTVAGPWTDLARSTSGAPFGALIGGVTVNETGTGATRTVEVRDLYLITDPAHPTRFLRLLNEAQ